MSTTTENQSTTVHDRAAWQNLTTLGIDANRRSGRRPSGTEAGRPAEAPGAWARGSDVGGARRTFQVRARTVVARVKRRIVALPRITFDES